MNADNFFTRRIMGMDYRVWGAMLFVCIVSVGLYGYRQIRAGSIGHQPCLPYTLVVEGKEIEVVTTCYRNRYSIFELLSDSSAKVEWDFRDGTELERGRIVSHKFLNEGTYKVTATVNRTCEYDVEVEIVDNILFSGKLEKPAIEIFADPMSPGVGNPVHFYCASDMPSITLYQWKVVGTNEIRNDAVPTFTFNKEGTYTIELVINGEPSTLTSSTIKVTSEAQLPEATEQDKTPSTIGPLGNLVPPATNAQTGNTNNPSGNGGENTRGNTPPAPDSSNGGTMPKARTVDEGTFKELLQAVINEDGKELEDLYEYLDYKGSTMVKVNENKSLIPLKDFNKNMRSKKKNKKKIQSLAFKMDDKKSIQTIQVKIQESIWGRINPFD